MAGALDFLTVQGPRPASYTPPPVSSDWIGNLPEDFQKGQQYGRLRQLQTMFQPGTPGAAALQQAGVAPGSLYGLLAGAGGAETVAPFAQRMQQGQIYQQLMGGQDAGNDLYGAILGQESGNRSNVGDSSAGAVGPGQIMPGTWKEFARPGENIRNPDDNRAVSRRILDKYMQDYNGDAARAAVAYYSGPGNVAPPGSPTPWVRNIQPRSGPPVSGYVAQVLGRMRTGGTKTAAAGQSDQLNPADRAAVDAMYPPGGQQPAAAVGTAPVGAPGAPAATPAVEQPEGATGQHPYIPQGNAAGPANIEKPAAPAQPPQQVAQAIPQGRYTEQAANNLQAAAANIRETVRRQGLAAAGSGLTIPPESMKAQLDQADKLDAQAGEIRKFLTEQTQKQLGIPLEEQTKAAGAVGEAQGKRVGEVIEAGGNARNTMNDLNTIEDAVRAGGDNVTYGPGAENWNKGKQILDRIFPQQGLAEADTIQKMNARLAAAAAKSMTARPSQLEFKTFVANNPGIMNSKEGTIALINILKQQAQHDIDLGRLANRTNPGDWPDREDRYYDENPLRSPFTGKPMTPPALPQAKMTGPEFAAWGQSMGLAPGDPIKVNGKLKHFVPPS